MKFRHIIVTELEREKNITTKHLINNMAQSSIEWLQQSMEIHLSHEQKIQFEGLYQQAKEMHEVEMHKCASSWRGNKIDKYYFNRWYKNIFKQ